MKFVLVLTSLLMSLSAGAESKASNEEGDKKPPRAPARANAPCKGIVTEAVEGAVRAAGIRQSFGFDLHEPEAQKKTDDGVLLLYSTIGTIRVEEGYLSDSWAEVLVFHSKAGCSIRKMEVQVGPTDL